MKLLRTIALDPSDTFVFDVAAEPGDWAVSGAFRFCDRDPAGLTGKDRSAFRSGFLGVRAWGWSTLVQIVQATAADRRALVGLWHHRVDLVLDHDGGERLPHEEVAEPEGAERGVPEISEACLRRPRGNRRIHVARLS